MLSYVSALLLLSGQYDNLHAPYTLHVSLRNHYTIVPGFHVMGAGQILLRVKSFRSALCTNCVRHKHNDR